MLAPCDNLTIIHNHDKVGANNGTEAVGDYDTGSRELGELLSYPIDLSSYEGFSLLLDFYHWREGEGTTGS